MPETGMGTIAPEDVAYQSLARTMAASVRAPVTMVAVTSESRTRLRAVVGMPDEATRAIHQLAHLEGIHEDIGSRIAGLPRHCTYVGAVAPTDRPDLAACAGALYSLGHQVTEEDVVMLQAAAEQTAAIFNLEHQIRSMADTLYFQSPVIDDEERWRLAIDESPDGIALARPDGTFLRVNDALADLLGYNRDDLMAMTWSTFTHPEDLAEHNELLRQVWEGEVEQYSMKKRYIRADGSSVWVSMNVRVAYDDDGAPLFTVAHISNISEQEAALAALAARTRELEQSNADLEHFAAIASHDLRSPLAAIMGYVEMLEDHWPDTAQPHTRDWLRRIASSASRMRELLESLLDYSRASRNSKATEVQTEVVIVDVVADLRREIRDSLADVNWDTPMPNVFAEEVPLRRLLQNLVQNAMKYARSGVPPIIHIHVLERPGEWLFEVIDNGIGVPDAMKDAIFEMFTQDAGGRGYGIGLATCRRIAQQHGGKIWVEDNPTGGSIFKFTIARPHA